MKKIILFVLFLSFFLGIAHSAPLMGRGEIYSNAKSQCKIVECVVSNRDGDISFRIDANCEGKAINGKLLKAKAVGDGKSIMYYGDLLLGRTKMPAEVIISVHDDGDSYAAIAIDGVVYELGPVDWD